MPTKKPASAALTYQLKLVLEQVTPPVWRRLLARTVTLRNGELPVGSGRPAPIRQFLTSIRIFEYVLPVLGL